MPLGPWPIAPGPWLALAIAAAAYAYGVRTLRRRGKGWSAWRSASFAAGFAVIAVALVSPLAARDDEFGVHVVQHLLLSMLAPLLLALSAPVTLALRTTSRRTRASLVLLLHVRVVRWVSNPVVATVVFTAGIVGLYFTPLYDLTTRSPLAHELVHLHFLASGSLVTWVFVGLDPVPGRGSRTVRLWALFVMFAVHAITAKLLYAGFGAVHGIPVEDVRAGAQIMYYGAEPLDALVLVAFFAHRYRADGRRLRVALQPRLSPAAGADTHHPDLRHRSEPLVHAPPFTEGAGSAPRIPLNN